MTSKWLITAIACAGLAIAGTANASGDADKGMAKAKTCAACHGAKGEGKAKNPAIAGMDAEKFEHAMEAYKSGAKKHAMMNALAKKLSEDDIEDLAAYYSSLK